ncbi:hypothetical protein BY998_10689 [Methylobacterium sp. B4]|nr:hypothetical protein BY998_10689 [Methylobacterium sp. B4]
MVPVVQPEQSAARLNATVQPLPRGTPFAFYRLIPARWTGAFGNTP